MIVPKYEVSTFLLFPIRRALEDVVRDVDVLAVYIIEDASAGIHVLTVVENHE